MPEASKIFTYEVDGLSYTVTVSETEDGRFEAEISVLEGAMDVNAVYFADTEFEGDSASLSGPLNMNGAKLDGEKVQWDDATQLSDPGLGPDADTKETYLQAGESLTLDLDIDSLDEIDIFGIRATSTTTKEGSIKAVSDDPEEPDPEPDPDPLTFEKVGFGVEVDGNDGISNGVFIVDEPTEGYSNVLPEGTEPTFENYLAYYENTFDDYDIQSLETIRFYTFDEVGEYPVELTEARIDAPEGGFQTSEEVLAAYDAMIESGALDGYGAAPGEESGMDLMAALGLGEDDVDAMPAEDGDLMDDLSEEDLMLG